MSHSKTTKVSKASSVPPPPPPTTTSEALPGPPPSGPPPVLHSQNGKKTAGREDGRERGSTLKPQLPEPTQYDSNIKNNKNVPLSSSKFKASQKPAPPKASNSSGSSHLATPRSIINKSTPRSLKEILEQKAEEKKQEEMIEEEAKMEADRERKRLRSLKRRI